MASVTKTGKTFVIVTRSNVGTTTGTFANKTVTLSGKGLTSGADFATTLTVKAGTKGRNPDGAAIGMSGQLFYKQFTPPPTDAELEAERVKKIKEAMMKKELEAELREAEAEEAAAAAAAAAVKAEAQKQQETASGENMAATAAQQAAAKAQQAAATAAAKKAAALAAKLDSKLGLSGDDEGGNDGV